MTRIPLGIARDALDVAWQIMESKTEKPSMRPYRDNPRVQALLAETEGLYGAADAYVRNALGEVWETLDRGEGLSKTLRAHAWLSRHNAFQRSREIVNKLYDLVGASAVYFNESPFDRHFRDIQTICQHMVGQTKELERVGQMLIDPEGRSSTLML